MYVRTRLQNIMLQTFYKLYNENMNDLTLYQDLTYIETYDDQVRTTTASLENVSRLLKDEKFLNLWNELINVSNIKRVFTKEMTDIDKVIYSIQDKHVRDRIKVEIDKRKKDGLRVSVWIIQNLLSKYQTDANDGKN